MQDKPWGLMVGVRPGKQLHKLLDLGWDYSESLQIMQQQYGIQEEKFALLWQVCQKERTIVMESSHPNLFSIYVGIPFCPTRCLYCSFPSHSLTELGKLRTRFVESLLYEIKETGKLAKQKGLTLYTVYLGGGTPTSLSPNELEQILSSLKTAFPGSWREFTVEAGRPDTISAKHVEMMKHFGVGRISVNPQSMHNATLRTIGRCHNTNDVRTAVHLVRAAGIPVLNMDLIIGLPGENTQMVEETLYQALALAPENITVHVFSRKRASKFNEDKEHYTLPSPQETINMQNKVREMVTPLYEPYYLYRQRDILGGLENIGYTLPGKECVYNIVMIEERHHILGLGGGATSKIINPDFTLQNIATPKDIRVYFERVNQLITRRAQALSEALKQWQKPST